MLEDQPGNIYLMRDSFSKVDMCRLVNSKDDYKKNKKT